MKTDTPRTDERKASFALDTIRQLETKLAAVTEQLKAAQDGWHDEITKGLSELRRAESIYTKAQERAEKAEEQRDRLAAYRDEFEDVAEIAIDILAGNHPLIDWRDAGQSELLRKLCQHLEENAPLSAMDEVREQRDEWKAKFIQQNKDLGCEMMDPNGTIWDYAKKLQTQLPTITKQRDKSYIEIEDLNYELTAVTEQRDRLETILKECLYEMPCSYVPNHTVENLPLMIASQTSMFAEEITRGEKLEKQRDLLIEVLEVTLNATVLNHRKDRWHSDAEYALHKIKLNLK